VTPESAKLGLPHARSIALYERACRVIPGGVNSPVRAFRAVGGVPLFIQKGAGQYLFDVDGARYLDLVNSWGALILGHAHPAVVAAVTAAVRNGTTFGAPCPGEVELAERIGKAYPALEQVRLVSSGTEAVMSAIRVARAATRRDTIVKFSGCYHGHADHLLVAAGSGLAIEARRFSAFLSPDNRGYRKTHARPPMAVAARKVSAIACMVMTRSFRAPWRLRQRQGPRQAASLRRNIAPDPRSVAARCRWSDAGR